MGKYQEALNNLKYVINLFGANKMYYQRIKDLREDNEKILKLDVTIYCEKESHKGIIIGKKGDMLKRISTKARYDMENFFQCKVNLQCWVKVKEGWRDSLGLIRNFGYDDRM